MIFNYWINFDLKKIIINLVIILYLIDLFLLF